MKKIFLLVAFIATAFLQKTFSQETVKSQPSPLLASYYEIKNALVAGNPDIASAKAEEFVTALNGTDAKSIDMATREALLKDASNIAKTKELKHQREHFAGFSTSMYTLAKAGTLSAQPVFYAYCPMKKAHWLSSEAAIKNPYFGSAMLSCGKVEETIK